MSETTAKILVVEDESNMREILSMLLQGEGYMVTTAADGAEGSEWLDRDIFDLIITDIKMPGELSGFDILKKTLEVSPETPVIMITAFGTMESAIDAMKLGAFDYVHKPFKIDEIRVIVKNAVDRKMLKTEVSLLRDKVKGAYEIKNIIGKSPAMQELQMLVQKIARSTSNVMVTGESGTGKELVANALHSLSPRADKNFVAINCASFPEGLLESELFGHMKGSFTGAIQNKQGLFEMADHGTLFLDEIAEMPLNLQSKLLRAIETGTFRRVGGMNDIVVDVRIIAATNRDIKAEAESGRFREDLFYRLNVIPLHIAPLRERKEDIPLFVEHFLEKFSDRKRQFAGSAIEALINREWRGNVRELGNLIERVLLLSESDIITASDLPEVEVSSGEGPGGAGLPEIGAGVDMEGLLSDIEIRYLKDALRETGGNKTEAAKLLGLTFRSLRHKLYKYGIK